MVEVFRSPFLSTNLSTLEGRGVHTRLDRYALTIQGSNNDTNLRFVQM